MSAMKYLRDIVKGPAHILYHVALIVVSAALALSLPYTAEYLANKFLVYWVLIGNEKIFLVGVELAVAVLLILLFNYAGRSFKDRRFARMARQAGLVSVSPARGALARWKSRLLKENQGAGREVMIIGSTGYRTFADARGDFHKVMRTCREAKVMLLNPFGEGARIRARSILDPDITPEHFREQIRRSISFLKELKAVQRSVRIKLYDEVPLLKMAISGDYLWLKHYHAGLDVQGMPEFVFRHSRNPGSLYMPLYEYFLKLWNTPGIPEYDLETDELVYRDSAGNEERREPFPDREPVTAAS